MEKYYERVSPGRISFLKEGEIFVYGSNKGGMNGAGAARYAEDHFGAKSGIGEGLQGQSYALPSMEGMESFREAVNRFCAFAKEHKELKFLVTRIGCGIAGYKDEDVAPLFAESATLENVYLPKSFWVELDKANLLKD